MSKSHESTAVESTSAVEIASAVVSASAVKISSGNILAETNDKVKTNRVQKRKAVHNNAKREAEVLKMQVGKDGKSTNGPLPLSKSRSRSISMDRRETHSPNLYGLPPSTSTNLQVSSFHSKQQRSRTQEKINEKQVGKDMRKPTNDPSISSKSRPRSISVDSRHATHSPDLKGRSTSNLSVSSFHVNQQRSRTRSRSSYSGSRRSSNRNSSKDTRSSRSHSQEHSLSPGKRSDHSNSRSYSSRSNKSLPSHRYSSQQHRSSSSRSRSPSINSIPNHHHNQRKQFHRRSNNRQRHSRSTSSRNSHGTSQQRSIVDIDRRMTRMEVTINKIFVMVGDVIKQTNKNLRLKNDSSNNAASKAEIPKNFAVPEFPLDRVNKLAIFNKMIKSKEIYDFMVSYSIQDLHADLMQTFYFQLQQEKDYCAPSKSSDNVVMTAYLKRFITLKLRCDIALKDPKGSQKLTLFGDYHRVYRFMIDVMKEGYLAYNKRIKSTEIHTILRTVWGRSNQMLQDERRKRNK